MITKKHIARATQIIYFLRFIATNAAFTAYLLRAAHPLAGLELGNHLFASSVNRLRATLAWKSGSVWHRRHCLVWASDDRDDGDNWCQLSTVRLDRRSPEG